MSFFSYDPGEELNKKKDLVDKEVALYRRQELVRFDEAAKQAEEDLYALRKRNVIGAFEAEHEYHSSKEKKGIELAKLDATISHKEELVKKLDSIPVFESRALKAEAEVASKDAVITYLTSEVTRLDEMVKFLATMLPKLDIEKVGITLNADVKVDNKKGEKEG